MAGDAIVLACGKGERCRAALARDPCRPLRAMADWEASGRRASNEQVDAPAGGVDHRAREGAGASGGWKQSPRYKAAQANILWRTTACDHLRLLETPVAALGLEPVFFASV